MTIIESVQTILESHKCRSAWDRGVNDYAIDLLENLKELDP